MSDQKIYPDTPNTEHASTRTFFRDELPAAAESGGMRFEDAHDALTRLVAESDLVPKDAPRKAKATKSTIEAPALPLDLPDLHQPSLHTPRGEAHADNAFSAKSVRSPWMEGEESPMSKMEATVKAVFAKKLFGRRRRDPLPLPERPRHIAVLLPADVGDVVCLSGMVKPLRMAQPQAQITAICLPKAAEAARLTDQYDRVVQLDPHGPDLHDHVLRVLPDLLVDLTYMCDFPQVIKDTCYEKISVICPILGMLGDGEHGLIDHVVDGSPYDHILHNAAKMLRRYDAQLTKLPTLELPSWARKWEVCQEYGNYLVIDPWLIRSAEKFQAWSEEKWAELMAIMPELKMNVLLLGGGHEKEYMARFAQHMQGRISAGGQIRHKVVDFTGQLTLHETAAFLFHSKGYVGVNGALGHVAAALDVPSVLLLTGQTDMQRGPLSVFSKVVMPPVGHPYIADISSRQVAEAVLEILKGWCFQGE